MPEQYKETVTARELRKGDKVSGKDGDHVVDAVDRKVKYVHVKMEGSDKIGYFQKEQPFEVTRTRLTEAEREAENLVDALVTLDRHEQRDRRYLKDAQVKIATATAEGRYIDWHDMETLVVAQERVSIWRKVANVHKARNGSVVLDALGVYEMTGGSYSEAEDDKRECVTRLDAVSGMRTALMQSIVKNLSLTHRSTAEASNLFEQYRLDAQAKWIEDLEWDVSSVIGNVLH